MMKKNLTYRIIAGCLSFLLMFALLPTGILNDIIPEVVPDISTEAEAAAGSTHRISGLFFIRINSNKNLYMTNSDWYPTQSTFEAKASGNGLLSQMWLIVNDGNYYYLRTLSDVMANQGGTWGNRWLSWDHGWNGYAFPTCKNIDGTVSAEPGNPTGQGTYKWELTSRTANADGTYTCYIKESAAAYYIQNHGGKVQTGRALGNTAGDLMYLEPCYDPMFENNRPLQFNNQPTGTTSYKINNSSSTTVNMTTSITVNSTWAVVEANPGYWYIINRATGYYLAGDQVNVGGSAVTKNVTGNPANDASIQWQIVRQRYTTFTTYIIINKGTQLVLQSNGSTASTSNYNFGNDMYTYWTLGYNADYGDEVPEPPQFYGWTSGTSKYYPATFSSQPGYVAFRANQAKSIDGDLTGYLFDTTALSKLGSTAQSLTNNSTNHFWYNSAYAGFSEWPTSHSLGTTRTQFSFPQSSGKFIWLIGHGTEFTAVINGTTYKVKEGIQKVSLPTSGTGTVDITAAGHFGIFTNVEPAAHSGSVTVSMSGTDGQVIHGDTKYTVTVSNGTNYTIDNVTFSVSIGGGHSVTVSVSNGSISSGNTNIAIVSGSGRSIAAGGSATFTITMKPGGMTGGTNYTLTANTGTYVSYNSASTQPNTTNTISRGTTYSKSLQECNGGSLTASVATSPNGGTVNGEVTYTISIKNGCNHAVSGINFTFGNILTIANGSVSSKHSSVTGVSGNSNSIGANSTQTITVKVNFGTGFTAGSAYQYAVSSGTATGGCSSTKTFSSGNTSSITTVTGDVTISVISSVSNNATVKGNVVYTITIYNGANHSVNNVKFTLKAGSTTLLSVNNDGTFSKADGVTVDISSIGTIASKGSVVITVTVDTTKLTAGSTYAVATSNGSATATGLASGSRSMTITTGSVQSFTTATGKVTVGLSSTTVNNNGVGEGNVSYTITLKNETNHALKGITFTLETTSGEKLLTVNSDGSITVHNSTLVKNTSVSVSGSLSNLASSATVTITGIIIDAKADVLDADGRLILVAKGNTSAKDVAGSLGDKLTYADSSDTFTILVRHDVNLLVQAGINTTVNADKILAAMTKSGATIYNGITGISAVTVTDINGNVITKTGFGSNGSNLVINLSDEYSEFIIKVTHNGGTILVPIQVSTVSGGDDKTFVLDYGLPVSIDKATMLDDVRLTGGAYSTAANAVSGFSANFGETASLNLTGIFGNFSYENNAFDYTTTKFINDEDVAYIVVLVGNANGTENVDFVKVYKKISFIPSNVIYYEDSLVGSITYPSGYELDELGELAGTGVSGEQDLPITGNMGFDDGSYANAKDVMISGESMHKVTVGENATSISFSFTGTGFELISRVNAKDAATLLIFVTDPSGSTKVYPVITLYDPNGNGTAEIYQVPVFRLNNGAYGEYQVVVEGLPNQDFDTAGNVISTETSYIYVDGIRVYNPLGTSDLTQHYGNEQGAEFTNIRDLILNGQGTLAAYTDQVTGFTTGSYYYVGAGDKWFSAAMGSINELGAMGANNEVLIRKDAGNHILVLKVKETTANAGLLQVGIHDIHDAKFDGNTGDNAPSSVSYNTVNGWVSLKSNFYSGTEQYYSIDLSKCPTDGDYKIVVLRVDSGFVSFTNVKHKNVEFGAIGEKALEIYTQPGFFFDAEGNMCTRDEDGNKIIVTQASDLFNLNLINDIMAQGNAENE